LVKLTIAKLILRLNKNLPKLTMGKLTLTKLTLVKLTMAKLAKNLN
jgi:hypothetical protein